MYSMALLLFAARRRKKRRNFHGLVLRLIAGCWTLDAWSGKYFDRAESEAIDNYAKHNSDATNG
jgi:hypothetical protein